MELLEIAHYISFNIFLSNTAIESKLNSDILATFTQQLLSIRAEKRVHFLLKMSVC